MSVPKGADIFWRRRTLRFCESASGNKEKCTIKFDILMSIFVYLPIVCETKNVYNSEHKLFLERK